MGGVVGFHPTNFENANGFPNVIFEWGVEDRILLYRIKYKCYDIKNENNLLTNHSMRNKFIMKPNNDGDKRSFSTWLKSYSEKQRKAFESRRDFESLIQEDGLNTLPQFTIIEQHEKDNIRHVKVEI